MSADIIDPAIHPGQFSGALPVTPGTCHTARPGTRNMPQLAQRALQRARVRHRLDHRALRRGHRRQPSHPDVNAHPGTGLGHIRSLRAANQHPNTRIHPCAIAANRNRQHPRPPAPDQPLEAPGVLLRADRADHRQREVAAVGLDPHRPGAKTHPIVVAAFAFEPREPDPSPRAPPGTGALPVAVGVHRAGDAIGVGLLRTFAPPHRTGPSVDTHLVLDGVPAFPQRLQ